MKPFSTAWTKDLEGDAKADFEALVRNSTRVLTRLKAIIEDRERQLINQGLSSEDFSDPNWSHKQAHRNGGLLELKIIKDLIPF